jgi:hypothetical protein
VSTTPRIAKSDADGSASTVHPVAFTYASSRDVSLGYGDARAHVWAQAADPTVI